MAKSRAEGKVKKSSRANTLPCRDDMPKSRIKHKKEEQYDTERTNQT
jgi:hypothetical protein